jgi:hypothetical protein
MKRQTLTQVLTSIDRWRTKAKRAMTMLDKLEKQKRRMMKAAQPRVADLQRETIHRSRGHNVPETPNTQFPEDKREEQRLEEQRVQTAWQHRVGEAAFEIPEFLQRVAVSKATDTAVAEMIKAEQAETKKTKARGRIERMKAKQRGDLKRMPLTGKAALEYIKNHGRKS